MKTLIKKLNNEKEELSGKIDRLRAALPMVKEKDIVQYKLLKEQLKAMITYKNILKKRITLLKTKPDN